MNLADKLILLRHLMKTHNVDVLYTCSSDPHQSESVSAHWKAVQWLTGYTGSVGICIVTMTEAAFWTDGRYTIQAKRELDEKHITVYTMATIGIPEWDEWLLSHSAENAVLSINASVISTADYRKFQEKLSQKQIQISLKYDLIGEIWEDRPKIPSEPLFELPLLYAGLDRPEKLRKIRNYIEKNIPGTDYYLAACLDDIAWLTNMRGHDNPLYPVFHAYVLISKTKAWLCTNLKKIPDQLQMLLQKDGYELAEYNEITHLLSKLEENTVIYLDPFKVPYLLYQSLPCSITIKEGLDCINDLKSRKSDAEQQNLRTANIYECVAAARLMKYIDDNVGKTPMDERQIGQKLEEYRKLNDLYLQPANIPIVGFGKNAALPHYRPTKENSCPVHTEGFLLFDVCAQYLCGTTDLTRTVAVGDLTREMKEDYTLTLKSHIALARQKFPYGTTGNILDGIVKGMHWNKLMKYNTGTGHGIGYVSSVHEGPCKIMMDYTSIFPYALDVPLDTGMLFSNEPGVYKPGRYGIRIENSIIVQEETVNEFGRFLGFETVTFLPYEKKAILVSQLTDEEKEWIDSYHQDVLKKLSPFLTPEETEWLTDKTLPLSDTE